MTPVNFFFKPNCIDFTAGWTTLVKAGREVSKLLENNAFSRAYRSKQLPEQKVCVSAGENNSGGLNDQEVNVLLSAAKKALIFSILNSVRFRIFHLGSGPVDITFILRWDGKFPCTLGLLKGRLSFLSLDQQFPAERQGRRRAGHKHFLVNVRIGPGVNGDFLVGQPCQRSTGFTQLKADEK